MDVETATGLGWASLPLGPLAMGIVNVTPDSFSDGGRSEAQAIAAAERMLVDGAAIIDVGGESTRPGALPVDPEEEQRRALPVIAALARQGAVVSVDTRHAATMVRALDVGARIVNDVSGLRFDPGAAAVVASAGCPVILMHMRGTPATMNGLAVYEDVVAEVASELGQIFDEALSAGVLRSQLAIDPGFGFAKNAGHNVDLLRGLSRFLKFRCPIIAGLSRKRFIGEVAGISAAGDRDAASVVAGLFALQQGASVLRVHDVRSTVQALRIWTSLAGPVRQ